MKFSLNFFSHKNKHSSSDDEIAYKRADNFKMTRRLISRKYEEEQYSKYELRKRKTCIIR